MAATYKAPLRDIRFVLHDVLDVSRISRLPGYEDATPDIFDAVLEEAAKMCENELFPLNRPGDEEGCTFENGVVRTPRGFKEAYATFIEGGWTALATHPEYGGQGLPKTLNFVVEEMICSANLAFGMYPGLSAGAYNAIAAHASDELKARYLPKLSDGTWSGTMCLTEPHCGTDLGLIRTKAVPADDGSFRITGTKIFISAGEHDLTENIIHLVLAKLPDAPEGTRGISLFLVPKFIPDANGAPAERNGVACGAIEHKMGIKASATCVLNFDDAIGWMVGEPHRGLQAMFTMMNVARLAVGMQGLGIGEAAYQGAVAYALDRTAGRALTGTKYPDRSADPIVVHPDVRRNLMTMRALNEGARALSYWIGTEIDVSHHHPDPAVRQEADDLVQLMTPIIKAFLTDLGFDNANRGVQIYGGHGYIREHGMEQYVRDARITQLYEGTNGIQAMDLVGRKLSAGMGRLLRRFFHPADAYIAAKKSDPALKEFVGPFAKAFQRLQQATAGLAQKAMANPDEAGAAASPYLRMFALVALAFMWTKMAEVATGKIAAGEDVDFHQRKLKTARFFMEQVLPEHLAAFAVAMAGAKTVMAMADDEF